MNAMRRGPFREKVRIIDVAGRGLLDLFLFWGGDCVSCDSWRTDFGTKCQSTDLIPAPLQYYDSL